MEELDTIAIYDELMTMQPDKPTFGECLYWTYANWQGLYAAASMGEEKMGKRFYMMRAHFFKKFKEGRQSISDLTRFNRIKFNSDGFCFYCYEEMSKSQLTADHVFPRAKGGVNDMDNIIFVCKSCNSSKGKRDLMEWFLLYREELPSPFVFGHYLREIHQYALKFGLMDKTFKEVTEIQLPFNPRCILLLLNTKVREHYFDRAKSGHDSEDYE